MQTYLEVPHEFALQKSRAIAKCTFSHVCSSYIPPICYSIRRVTKEVSDLSIYYNSFGLLGQTLQNFMSKQRRESIRLAPEEVSAIFRKLLECLAQVTRFTGEYGNFAPCNIFYCQRDEGSPVFVSNFSMDFSKSRYEKQYQCSSDSLYREPPSKRTVEHLVRSATLQTGLIMLELITLLPSAELFEDGNLSKARVDERLDKLEARYQPVLAQMLSAKEQSRADLQTLLKEGAVGWPKTLQLKSDKFIKLKGHSQGKDIEGLSECLYSNLTKYSGAMKGVRRRGYGVFQDIDYLQLGLFDESERVQFGVRVYKNKAVWIGDNSTLNGLLCLLGSQSASQFHYQKGSFEESKAILRLVRGETLHREAKLHRGYWKEGLQEGRGVLVDLRGQSTSWGTWVGGVIHGEGVKLEDGHYLTVVWDQGAQSKRTALEHKPSLKDYEQFAAM